MEIQATVFTPKKDASGIRRVEDPQWQWGNVRHKLIDILVIGLCSAITRGEGFDEMEELGRAREDYFRTPFAAYSNG